jgi:hypothetical protein
MILAVVVGLIAGFLGWRWLAATLSIDTSVTWAFPSWDMTYFKGLAKALHIKLKTLA